VPAFCRAVRAADQLPVHATVLAAHELTLRATFRAAVCAAHHSAQHAAHVAAFIATLVETVHATQ
jgi:hypothetical protein